MTDIFKSKRVIFPKGYQKKFIIKSKNKLNFTWNQMAKNLNISTRNLIDWKNEKISMSFNALKILCKKTKIKMPKNIKIIAENHFIAFSGIFLPSTMPNIIPITSATSIPDVVPSHTPIKLLYLAARATVVSWVLSPISAKKKAIATVQNGLKLNLLSSSSRESPLSVQAPKIIKDAEVIIFM